MSTSTTVPPATWVELEGLPGYQVCHTGQTNATVSVDIDLITFGPLDGGFARWRLHIGARQ